MSINLIRYDAGDGPAWGVMRGHQIVALPGDYPTTAEVLGDGVRHARALLAEPGAAGIDPAAVKVLSPVPRARVYCQGANYRAHMIESGMDPDRSFNMLFTKSTASLTGPDDDIVTPSHVRLLDYEVELGIVIGKPISGPVTVTEDTLADYVGAFVLANDVSARDVQLPQGQWYKGKSYRTFCPVGPYLAVPDEDEVARWRELRLSLSVNGEPRQDSLAGDMVFQPAATLTEFSQPGELPGRRRAAHRHPRRGRAAAAQDPRATDRRPAARGHEVEAVRQGPGAQQRLPQARRSGHRIHPHRRRRPRPRHPAQHRQVATMTQQHVPVLGTTLVRVDDVPDGGPLARLLDNARADALLLRPDRVVAAAGTPDLRTWQRHLRTAGINPTEALENRGTPDD